MRIFVSEYSLKCEYLLECEICVNFCEYSLLNEYFKANIRQYEKTYSFWQQIEYLYSNLCEYFEANISE
jgi:hypothetical protein